MLKRKALQQLQMAIIQQYLHSHATFGYKLQKAQSLQSCKTTRLFVVETQVFLKQTWSTTNNFNATTNHEFK